MTLEETKRAAEVMLAHAEGKMIQCLIRDKPLDEWEVVRNPVWEWTACDYRVAPELWSGKIWVHPDGAVSHNYDQSTEYMKTQGWRLIEAKEVGE